MNYFTGLYTSSGKVRLSDPELINQIKLKKYSGILCFFLSRKKLANNFRIIKSGGFKQKCSITRFNVSGKITSYLWIDCYDKDNDFIRFLCKKTDFKSELKNIFTNSFFRQIIQPSPDVVLLLDSDMNIDFFNKKAEKLFNLKKYREKKNFLHLYPGSESFIKTLSDLGKNRSLTDYEIVNVINNKRQYNFITASIFNTPLTGNKKYLLFIKDVSNVIIDYSKQMKSNLELLNTNEMLKKNYANIMIEDKLASVGQLSAGIAHEINNPLGYLSSNLEILLKYTNVLKDYVLLSRTLYNNNENFIKLKKFENKHDLEYIFSDLSDIGRETSEGIIKIDKIIKSLGSFSKKNILQKHEIYNINRSIEDILAITINEYKYSIEIDKHLGVVSDIYCMPAEINQALLNIFMNSIDACKSKGKNGKIFLKTYDMDNFVHIIIENNGAHIPSGILEKIYEPFFTTKNIGEGMGLGLAISLDIIRNKHQGNISVENTENGVINKIAIPIVLYNGG